jgi:hypothetical protein
LASIGPDWQAREFLRGLGEILGPFADRLALIGGLAVNQHRRPRFTDDVDFMAPAGSEIVEAIVRRMAEDGYEVVKSFGEKLPSGPDFIRVARAGSPAVEFLTAKTDFQDAVITRAVSIEGLQNIRIATPEDLVVLKLVANRSQDHLDLLELGRIPALDWSYIEHWAPIWDISDRLADLRALLARPE